MNKNRIKKTTKIVLKTGKREERNKKSNQGVNLIKIHYMHGWKYHNKNPLYN
jgi:hypothetical protein